MNKVVSATKARQNLFKLLEEAEKPGASVTITVDGAAKVVMVSAEEFAGWQETLEVMSDPNLMKGIQAGLKDLKAGKIYSESEMLKKMPNV